MSHGLPPILSKQGVALLSPGGDQSCGMLPLRTIFLVLLGKLIVFLNPEGKKSRN
jgi:hypothetical protein